jgi:hypothetical protein
MEPVAHAYQEHIGVSMKYRWETSASVWLEDVLPVAAPHAVGAATAGPAAAAHAALAAGAEGSVTAPAAPLAPGQSRFTLASTAGLSAVDWSTQPASRLPDIAHVLGASLPRACACSPIYPEGFSYCPHCGAPLERLEGLGDGLPDWLGPAADPRLPRHLPQGLAVTALPLAASLEERPGAPAPGRAELQLPAPPNAHCLFVAAHAGFPVQRLLALAPARNVLQYWDPLGLRWEVLLPEDPASTVGWDGAYAWLPAPEPRRGELGLVPTRAGLQRLWINPVNDSYRTELVQPGVLAGAPAAMRRHIACPLRADNGSLQLWSALGDASGASQQELDAPTSGYARPVGYDGGLLWLHEAGQLIWHPGFAARWQPWADGWQPRLHLGGPTQSRDGRLWQLGHDGQQYSFVELLAEQPEVRPVDGARLGWGGFLFRRGHAVLGEPWDQEHVEDQHDHHTLVLPLLRAFDNQRAQPGGLVLRLHQVTGRAEEALGERVQPRATVEWIGQRNVILDEVVRLLRPQDCQPFVYDGCLWLHHPDWNQMRGWRLDRLP